MKQCIYPMGSSMTFPLELAQIKDEDFSLDNRYLYPVEVMEIQQIIEDRCDQMEYDGSLMYDEYPDKVCIEAMAKNICKNVDCKYQEEISNRWMCALIQMMVCNEMSYRRERRSCHKRNLGKCNQKSYWIRGIPKQTYLSVTAVCKLKLPKEAGWQYWLTFGL